jgi:Rrf2 family protein
MFKLTKEVDMGIFILGHLMDRAGLVSAQTTARDLHLPLPWVKKVLKRLAAAKLVESVPGRTGGYRVKARTRERSLAHLVEAMQGPLALTLCSGRKNACSARPLCGASTVIREINRKIYAAFDGVKVGQITSRR